VIKNILKTALDKVTDEVTKINRKADDTKLFASRHASEIVRVQKGMEPVEQWLMNASLDVTNRSLDLSYSGNKHTMDGIWHALRKMGYKADTRPKSNEQYFSTWFRMDGNVSGDAMKIYLSFSSTVCKRVKVGTKMVEQDVYETRCE